MVDAFISGSHPCPDLEAALVGSAGKLQSFKESGNTMWEAEKWMLTREAYRQMSTVELTSEVLSRPIFGMEMLLFKDPRFGIQRFTILHEGFAELASRQDLWRGILHYYSTAEDEINPEAAPETILNRAMNLSGLSSLFVLPQSEVDIRPFGDRPPSPERRINWP